MNSKLFNSDLEMTIIGNLILDSELDHTDILPEMFYYSELRTIFEGLCDLKSRDEPLETLHIELESYSGVISNCTDCGVVTTNYTHNCNLLKSLYASRLVYDLGDKIKTVNPKKLHEYISRLQTRLDEIEMIVGHENMKTINPDNICFDINKKGYISTGFDAIDYALNDLEPKRVTLITGKSHHGKTTFVRSIIANAINTDNKVLWVMGENEHSDEIRRLYQLVVGRKKGSFDLVQDNKRKIKIPTKETLAALKKWHKDKLLIIHKAEAKLKNHNQLLDLVEKELKVNKHNLIVIDNLMSVLSAKSVEKNETQADFMQSLCDISKVYNTHIILVLHPRKDTNYSKPDNDHISGTGDLANKADNVIFVTRLEDSEERETGYMYVTKNKRWGTTIKVPTIFDEETEALAEMRDGVALVTNYHIERFFEEKLF